MADLDLPEGLVTRVTGELERDGERPWDDVLADRVEEIGDS